MKKLDLAYAAGIFDGEGSICIYKQKTRPRNQSSRRGFYYGICIDMANTNDWLCRQFQFWFGGGLRYIKRKKTGREANWRNIWHWNIVGARGAGIFLELILPYLKIKKPQAEIALQFCKLESKKRRNFVLSPKTDEEMAVEEAKRIMLQDLNKRGVK